MVRRLSANTFFIKCVFLELMANVRRLGTNLKWRMENGKWKMENGEWKMENGDLGKMRSNRVQMNVVICNRRERREETRRERGGQCDLGF